MSPARGRRRAEAVLPFEDVPTHYSRGRGARGGLGRRNRLRGEVAHTARSDWWRRADIPNALVPIGGSDPRGGSALPLTK
eukprot:8914873-Pyramimonas_sp.AAC.1